MPNPDPHSEPSPSYVVVARRYRPQGFGELIGQEHVAQALSNAIATHRVGHAYLFTGARGTGKTSTARIFAKALNCVNGPTAEPCNQCDTCQRISTGDDVDVLEIDGASNRGIDDIRGLRQNVNVRPSRSRFKIYIIDEVHMLSREAFNALLKTLEEPPEHVKFIFCTTEATKIPITILSRCQRFDFAGISTRAIFDRLRQIVAAEGVEAEDEALEVLARRAAGSMRDSQSLLEQLLSFASQRITVAEVHGMLGTAGDQRLTALVKHLVERNAAAALGELGATVQEGVDVAQLIEQLFGYFRDCMVAAVGCPADTFLYASTANSGDVIEAGRRLGLQTILAVMQILDQSLSRMRFSTQARILAELALVRICNLEDLEELSSLIVQLRGVGSREQRAGSGERGAGSREQGASSGSARLSAPPASSAPPSAKKKYEPVAESPVAQQTEIPLSAPRSPLPAPSESDEDDDSPAETGFMLSAANATETWRRAIEKIPGMTGDYAKKFDRLEISGMNRVTVFFSPEHAFCKTACQRPEQVQRFEQALRDVTGQTIRVEFKLLEALPQAKGSEPPKPVPSPHQRLMEAASHPLVRRASELFGAQPTAVEEG
jgi:DNA polymerase-3 subunit gamma/tau